MVEVKHVDTTNVPSDELCHYGVLGMKWGVRKNPSKAYARAVRKKERIANASVSTQLRGIKRQYDASRKIARAGSLLPTSRGMVKQARAGMYQLKSATKGRRWEKAMDKTFKDYDVKKIPNGNLTDGRNFVYRFLYGNDKYEVTKRN